MSDGRTVRRVTAGRRGRSRRGRAVQVAGSSSYTPAGATAAHPSRPTEYEGRDVAAAPPQPDQPDQPDPQLTEADLAEISDPHPGPIPFPKEAQPEAVSSPEVQKTIDALQRLKASAGAHEALCAKVRGLLKADAVPMEHQKRTAQFLHTSVSEFNMAGNGLPCGMGKTFDTIMYVLHSGKMGVICGKMMLHETWRREIERVMPEGSYAVIKVGPASFCTIEGMHVFKDGVVEPVKMRESL
jgi:hypothetical protein